MSSDPTIIWTVPKLKAFIKVYARAVADGKPTFVFEGHEFVVEYAEYVIQYLQRRFGL